MTPDDFLSEIKRTLPGLRGFSPVWHHKGENGPEVGVSVDGGIPVVRTATKWRVNFCTSDTLLGAWNLALDWVRHERETYSKQARAMKRAMKAIP